MSKREGTWKDFAASLFTYPFTSSDSGWAKKLALPREICGYVTTYHDDKGLQRSSFFIRNNQWTSFFLHGIATKIRKKGIVVFPSENVIHNVEFTTLILFRFWHYCVGGWVGRFESWALHWIILSGGVHWGHFFVKNSACAMNNFGRLFKMRVRSNEEFSSHVPVDHFFRQHENTLQWSVCVEQTCKCVVKHQYLLFREPLTAEGNDVLPPYKVRGYDSSLFVDNSTL